MRNPSFGMDDRLLLDKIDYKTNPLSSTESPTTWKIRISPTVDAKNPYALSPEEDVLIDQLTRSFLHSEKAPAGTFASLLQRQSLSGVYNGNLLFHGCVPMTEQGELMSFSIGCDKLAGAGPFRLC